MLVRDVVLALPFKKRTTGISRSAANRWIEATNCLLIGSARHVDAKLAPDGG